MLTEATLINEVIDKGVFFIDTYEKPYLLGPILTKTVSLQDACAEFMRYWNHALRTSSVKKLENRDPVAVVNYLVNNFGLVLVTKMRPADIKEADSDSSYDPTDPDTQDKVFAPAPRSPNVHITGSDGGRPPSSYSIQGIEGETFDIQQMLSLIGSQRIDPVDLVSKDGAEEKPASSYPEFKPAFERGGNYDLATDPIHKNTLKDERRPRFAYYSVIESPFIDEGDSYKIINYFGVRKDDMFYWRPKIKSRSHLGVVPAHQLLNTVPWGMLDKSLR